MRLVLILSRYVVFDRNAFEQNILDSMKSEYFL